MLTHEYPLLSGLPVSPVPAHLLIRGSARTTYGSLAAATLPSQEHSGQRSEDSSHLVSSPGLPFPAPPSSSRSQPALPLPFHTHNPSPSSGRARRADSPQSAQALRAPGRFLSGGAGPFPPASGGRAQPRVPGPGPASTCAWTAPGASGAGDPGCRTLGLWVLGGRKRELGSWLHCWEEWKPEEELAGSGEGKRPGGVWPPWCRPASPAPLGSEVPVGDLNP